MLRSIKDMEHYAIAATDGIIGHVKDFYFDDEAWAIRYLVVETGDSTAHRKVLISPIAVTTPNWPEKVFPVALTRAQVAKSPDIDTDKPVSRQQEAGYLGYYGYGTYWGGGGLWGGGLYPDMLQGGLQATASKTAAHQNDDPHLRSANAVMRYYVHATDGDIGHVQGMLVDERTWAIRFIVVDTSNWYVGHKVLIAPEWIQDVFWLESILNVAITRQAVKDAPAYDAASTLDREQEESVYQHHRREAYWLREHRPSSTR
ncbi:MAG: PRC-barrel domain-containing protein [Gammaproteobacteria bacterium]